MPQPMRKRWIKLWTEETLYGTTSKELTLPEQAIWFKFLALAGNSIQPGIICVAPDIPYTDQQLADLVGTSPEMLKTAKAKMEHHQKINQDQTGIHILNWTRYQETRAEYMRNYMRQRRLTSKPNGKQVNKLINEVNLTSKPNGKQVEEEGRKRGDPPSPLPPFTNVKGFKDLKNKVNKLVNKKEKIGFCIDAFKFYHFNAPPDDLENSGGRIAGMLKSISYDYGFLLDRIWESRIIDISGSHLNYIQGMLKGKDGVRLEDSGMYKEL